VELKKSNAVGATNSPRRLAQETHENKTLCVIKFRRLKWIRQEQLEKMTILG
jgi:hypothetical protein